jgi:hypothetical protein
MFEIENTTKAHADAVPTPKLAQLGALVRLIGDEVVPLILTAYTNDEHKAKATSALKDWVLNGESLIGGRGEWVEFENGYRLIRRCVCAATLNLGDYRNDEELRNGMLRASTNANTFMIDSFYKLVNNHLV